MELLYPVILRIFVGSGLQSTSFSRSHIPPRSRSESTWTYAKKVQGSRKCTTTYRRVLPLTADLGLPPPNEHRIRLQTSGVPSSLRQPNLHPPRPRTNKIPRQIVKAELHSACDQRYDLPRGLCVTPDVSTPSSALTRI